MTVKRRRKRPLEEDLSVRAKGQLEAEAIAMIVEGFRLKVVTTRRLTSRLRELIVR